MNIRYRSKFTGTFISAKSAATKKYSKAVISELVDTKTKKVLGRSPGYFNQSKKLARVVLRPLTIKPVRRYTPPPLDDDDGDGFDIADIREESEWEQFEDEYPALDALDELDELEDEDEWYEEA